MNATIFTALCAGKPGNCSYPNKVVVTCASELKAAVAKDHVCAEYRDNLRSKKSFVRSDVIVMDIDNDHSENEADWITQAKLSELFPDVELMAATSRHHMLPKDRKKARPKFHVYFPIEECTDSGKYAAMKRALQKQFSFFDGNALDAGRFIFGSNCEEVYYQEGRMTVDEAFDLCEDFDGNTSSDPILQGSRNKTMSHFAGRLLKKYGITEKAQEAFYEHATKCEPPLSDAELEVIWESAAKFYRNMVMTQPGYISPEAYQLESCNMKPDDYSDIGEARVLAREYGNELCHTNGTGYLRYDGTRWAEDKQLAIGAVEEFLDLQLEDAKDEVERCMQLLTAVGIDENTIKAGGKTLEKEIPKNKFSLFSAYQEAQNYLKFVKKRRDYKYIMATANTAKPMLTIDMAELDMNPLLLNTPDGTVNLRDGNIRPHDPYDRITKVTACSSGDEGKDIWLAALDTFFVRNQELIDYVQEIVGMSVIGKVYAEHMIIAYGGGANGKSTFWNAIYRVMGNYSGKISAEALTVNCRRNVKPEMAELKGKRLVISSEMEEGMRLNTSMIKQLCSTDEIQAEKKYKDPFVYVPSHTLVLYTNHLPKVGASDDGIWRRLVVIPFNAKITGKSDIKNYADYLVTHAGSYILRWIIEGAEKAIAKNFHIEPPQVVQDAIEAYREDNNWLGQFIAECCEEGAGLEEKSGELYRVYRANSIQNGEYARGTRDFYAALDLAGYHRSRHKGGVVVHGITLKKGHEFL